MPIAIPGGIYWPFERRIFSLGSSNTIDATGEYIAGIGQVYFEDRASGTKTLDTSGSSAIRLYVPSRVWASAGSAIRIGLKTLDKTSGPPVRPGSTWLVDRTLTQGTDTINNGATLVVVPTSGTVTLSHGDEICIVADFTNRAGSDSLNIQTSQAPAGATFSGHPFGVTNASGSAATAAAPFFYLTFSDGSGAWLDGHLSPAGVISTTTFTDAANPDERGNCFQVPFDCSVDQLWFMTRINSAASDGIVTLYSTPLGTPTAIASWTFTAEELGTAGSNFLGCRTITPVSLSANTDYCLAVRATSTGTLRVDGMTLLTDTGPCRQMWPGGESVKFAFRQNGSGAFSVDDTQVMSCGVRICELASGGGSGAVRPLSRILNTGA